jgi:hypothetical protein
MGARTKAEQKEAERAIAELRQQGLLQLFRAGNSQRVRLTPSGDELARRLIGAPTIADCVSRLESLAKFGDQGRGFKWGNKLWHSETALAGVSYSDANAGWMFSELEMQMAPALWRDWARSNSSVQRHGWYCLTAADRSLWAAAVKDGERHATTPPDDSLLDLYKESRQYFWSDLASSGDGERDIGEIPIPVSA